MTEAPHTPGPWEVKTLEPHSLGVEWISSPHGDRIAECHRLAKPSSYGFCVRPELVEIAANARLIAAAPDLLAVAEAALDMVDGDGSPPNWNWIREVVAKAKATTT